MTNNDEPQVTAEVLPWTPPTPSDFDKEGWECKACVRADMLGLIPPHIHYWDEESQTMHVLENLA